MVSLLELTDQRKVPETMQSLFSCSPILHLIGFFFVAQEFSTVEGLVETVKEDRKLRLKFVRWQN
jgi:hypothetical protein